MKLILARHGETAKNALGIVQGQLDFELNEKGIEQANLANLKSLQGIVKPLVLQWKLALRLSKEKIDLIYSSDLKRASATALEIKKFHPKAKLIITPEIKERNWGDFQGLRKSEMHGDWDNPPNGESNKQLFERATKFIEKLFEKHKQETILIVAHGGINKRLTALITKMPFERLHEIESIKNAGISVFEIDENKNHKVHLLNCTKHLE